MRLLLTGHCTCRWAQHTRQRAVMASSHFLPLRKTLCWALTMYQTVFLEVGVGISCNGGWCPTQVPFGAAHPSPSCCEKWLITIYSHILGDGGKGSFPWPMGRIYRTRLQPIAWPADTKGQFPYLKPGLTRMQFMLLSFLVWLFPLPCLLPP